MDEIQAFEEISNQRRSFLGTAAMTLAAAQLGMIGSADYHLLLDEQAEQIFATTDALAERVRKVGGTTLRSIGHIARLQRVLDNDADFVTPSDMLAELRDDNKQLVARLRETHGLCDDKGDIAGASLLETWIDEAERRTWFLFEASRSRSHS